MATTPNRSSWTTRVVRPGSSGAVSRRRDRLIRRLGEHGLHTTVERRAPNGNVEDAAID